MKQNSEKKNFLHKADRQNMPVCFITGKIYRKQEYEIKTETDCKIVTVHSVHSNVAKIPDCLRQWNFGLYVSGFWHIHAKTPRGTVVCEQ